ncbi:MULTISPECIES: hypothetical protein [unclassified Bradyrhizobium]|uniref:hypothetical protein n=1 Tax=unclassified Bradyrhizobium TaxID=2631580 RepID=UPI001FF8FF43|nr:MULTISPECIES: hypothetical protein [unclassified Bradyrhizobium]MCK1502933.1 hypothetical protein [Bradyrhizobium sp. 188]UPJ80690.1 hypothetical protein IVB17_01215 [Bradyrhizobium sp. 184]UPJ88483.1 hypothetical protein IVB16_01215 [Bradyrhizobium sp. 183]
MTIESLGATGGIAGRPKELALALKHLVERGPLRPAGEDPIPGSAIAFRLVSPTSPERLAKAKDQPRPSGSRLSPAEAIAQRSAAK